MRHDQYISILIYGVHESERIRSGITRRLSGKGRKSLF